MKKLTAVAILLVLSTTCNASNLELSIGGTDFGQRGDGIWHQKQYGAYTLNTRSSTLAVGITDKYNGMRWRVGVQHLGKYSTRCDCLSSDTAYLLYKQGVDIGWPTSYYRTKGSSYGVYASVLPEYKLGYNTALFFELGIGYFSVSNKVSVRDWYPASNFEHTEWLPARNLRVDNGRRWRLTPIVGVGIRHENMTLSVTVREINTKGPWYPIAAKYGASIELRYSFDK